MNTPPRYSTAVLLRCARHGGGAVCGALVFTPVFVLLQKSFFNLTHSMQEDITIGLVVGGLLGAVFPRLFIGIAALLGRHV